MNRFIIDLITYFLHAKYDKRIWVNTSYDLLSYANMYYWLTYIYYLKCTNLMLMAKAISWLAEAIIFSSCPIEEFLTLGMSDSTLNLFVILFSI